MLVSNTTNKITKPNGGIILSNTVINIYGDVNITIEGKVSFDGSLSEMISSSIIKATENQMNDHNKDRNYEKTTDKPRPPKNDVPCHDIHGRWSNEAERDAWRRFYRANTYC